MPEEIEDDQEDEFSSLPEPISRLLDRLSRNLQDAPSSMVRLFVSTDRNSSGAMERLLRKSQRSIDVASDLRSVITAYAHVFQKPRPNFSELAAAQGISSTGIRRRYTGQTVEALKQILGADPDLKAILRGLPSLELSDLAGLSPAIDRALAESDFIPYYDPPEVDSRTASQVFLTDIEEGVQVELPVSLVESHAAESQQTPAHALLGQVTTSIRGDLNSAEWHDAWVQDEVRARFEWAGGMQMEQFLARVVPFYGEYAKEPQNLISGIHALRVTKHDSKTAQIEWFIRPQVSLFVTRQPKSMRI